MATILKKVLFVLSKFCEELRLVKLKKSVNLKKKSIICPIP